MWRALRSRWNDLRQHPVYRKHRLLVLWRAAAWSWHCLLRIPAKAKFRRWNFRLFLRPKWRGSGCTSPYLFREYYEPELMLLEQYLKPGMVFVDGGANTGVFTCTAARLVGATGRVLAFEPGQSCLTMLRRSIALNQFTQVQLHAAALSDHRGTARLYHHQEQENAFSLGGGANVPYDEVPIVTLDEIATTEQLSRIDFIKLDVEGAEELVLRGASNVLRQWQPIVLFEVNVEAIGRMQLASDGACRVLEEYGYHLFRMNEAGELTPNRGIFKSVTNILAVLQSAEKSRRDSKSAQENQRLIPASAN